MTEQHESIGTKAAWAIPAAAVLLVIGLLVGMGSGTVQVSPTEIVEALRAGRTHEMYTILYDIRLPRVVVGALAGINLALAGAILQGVLRNPLADPGLLGVTAGAGLAGMVIMILFPAQMMWVPPAAFVGAMAATFMVYGIAWRHGVSPLRLVLAGVALAAFFGGFMTLLTFFYSERVQGTVGWMAGGFSGRSWDYVLLILPYTALGLTATMFATKSLTLLSFGDDVARSLGVRVERTRILLLTLAALLAASAVSVAGMLGFVGLIVPHIARLIVGGDFARSVPLAVLLGAVLILFADTFARTAFSPIEVPVGVLMSFIGAPFFLYLLRKEVG